MLTVPSSLGLPGIPGRGVDCRAVQDTQGTGAGAQLPGDCSSRSIGSRWAEDGKPPGKPLVGRRRPPPSPFGGPEKRRRGPEDGQPQPVPGAAAERLGTGPRPQRAHSPLSRRPVAPRAPPAAWPAARPAAPLPAAWPGSGAPSDPGALRGGGAGGPAAARARNANGGGCSISPTPTDPATGGGEGEEQPVALRPRGRHCGEGSPAGGPPPPEPPPARSAPDTRPAPLGASQGHPAFARGRRAEENPGLASEIHEEGTG